jgi:light-regulated signal transduction histidine kinase (bacteriophytochrome)
VTVCIEPNLVAHGDETLLRVLLENLFNNAWKFTARRPDAVIAFGREMHGGIDTFCVRDNGAGFDMQFAHRLFKPFERLHTDSDFQGTGIGLATVRRIVERHNGRVWAESGLDQGASVYFSLGMKSG